MTQQDLADKVGMGLSVIYGIERGARDSDKILHSHRAVVRALGWSEKSVEALLGGGDPIPESAPGEGAVSEKPADLPGGLPERTKLALSDGRVLDSAVISASSGVKVSLVLTAGEEVSAEELVEAYFPWFDRIQELVRETRPSLDLGPEGGSSSGS